MCMLHPQITPTRAPTASWICQKGNAIKKQLSKRINLKDNFTFSKIVLVYTLNSPQYRLQ